MTIEDNSKIKLLTFQAYCLDVLSAFVTTSSLTNVACEKRRFNEEREGTNVRLSVKNELQKQILKKLDLSAYAILCIVLWILDTDSLLNSLK